MKYHYVWIDWMRTFSMCMIVWGHFFPYGFTPFVYAFNVPVFFFLSGLLANKSQSWTDFWRKNLRTLVIPYTIICSIKAMGYTFSHGIEGTLHSSLGIIFGFHTFYSAPGAKTMWFVYTLLFIKVLQHNTSVKKRCVSFRFMPLNSSDL